MNKFSIFDKQNDKIPIVKEFISNLPFINDHNFKWNDREGYRGNGVFGSKSGPTWNFEAVAHEMGHAIDTFILGKHKRLKSVSWGLEIKSFQDIAGKRYYEPVTMQATECECRAVAYQKHIMEIAGDPDAATLDIEMAETLVRFMPDWMFGGNNTRERMQTRINLINNYYNKLDKSDIPKIWANISQIIYN